ncbi:hypothetical protein GCM10020258_02530 [Sphingomonas yabuuchiae]
MPESAKTNGKPLATATQHRIAAPARIATAIGHDIPKRRRSGFDSFMAQLRDMPDPGASLTGAVSL